MLYRVSSFLAPLVAPLLALHYGLVVLGPNDEYAGAGSDITHNAITNSAISSINQTDFGFANAFSAWHGTGGMVGVLAEGPAMDEGYGGVSDGHTILIDLDGTTQAEFEVRLWHEFQHTQLGGGPNGGYLDPCQHAVLFRDTMNFALDHAGQVLDCQNYENLRNQALRGVVFCPDGSNYYSSIPDMPEWCD